MTNVPNESDRRSPRKSTSKAKPFAPGSSDSAVAAARAVEDPRLLKGLVDQRLGHYILPLLLQRYTTAISTLSETTDMRASKRIKLSAQEKTSQGKKPDDAAKDVSLGKEITQLAAESRQCTKALRTLIEALRATEDTGSAIELVLAAALQLVGLSPSSARAARIIDESLEPVAELLQWVWGQDLVGVSNRLVLHVRELTQLRRFDRSRAWLKHIDEACENIAPDFWQRVVQHALLNGERAVLPERLTSDSSAQVGLLARSVQSVVDRIGLPRVSVTDALLASTNEPAWLGRLPFVDSTVNEVAALWSAFLRSPGGRGTPLGLATERLLRDEVGHRSRADREAIASLTFERDGATLRVELGHAELEELRASLADARAQALQAGRAPIHPEALKAAAGIINELRRMPEAPERLVATAEALRRSLGLDSIAKPQDAVDDADPELFDFVGDPSGDKPVGRILRSAWVVEVSPGEQSVVLRGAVVWQ